MKKRRKYISILCILALVVTTVCSTSAMAFGASKKDGPKYWLKVNAQANVVTVYKKLDGKWKPYRAMLCSTGTGKGDSYEATPVGTYSVQSRWDWGAMVGGVYARYVVQFYGDFLFHSVPYETYGDQSSMPTKEFNKLGKDASHGCVRLSLMDAKWIYDNIPRGSKVTVYNSKNPGPLGKPKGIKLTTTKKYTWDPTDPDKDNPKYKLPKPVITVASSKKLEVQKGTSYKLKKGVTAQDPNTFQDLTGSLTVYKVKKYNKTKKKYVEAKFSTKKEATYKVTYKVKYKYGGPAYKTIKIKVVDKLKAPTLSGASSRTVTWGSVNAVKGVTAKQYGGSRTSAIKVSITAPGESKAKTYTYASAKKYQFDRVGAYKVKYVVKNKYKPYRSTSKTVTITSAYRGVNADPILTVPSDLQAVTTTVGETRNFIDGVKATHNQKDVTSKIKYAIRKPNETTFKEISPAALAELSLEQVGQYEILYSVTNTSFPYQTVYTVAQIDVTM